MHDTKIGLDALKTLLVHPDGVEIEKIIMVDLLEPIRRVKPLLEQFDFQDNKVSDFLVRWIVGMFQNNSTNINDFADEINNQHNEAFESILAELMSLTSHQEFEDHSEEKDNHEHEMAMVADEISLTINQYVFDTLLQLGVVQPNHSTHTDLKFWMDYHPDKYYAVTYVLRLKPGFDWDYVQTGMAL